MKIGAKFFGMMLALAFVVTAGLLWIFHGLVVPWQTAAVEKNAADMAFYIGRAIPALDARGRSELLARAKERAGEIDYIIFEDTLGVILDHTCSGKIGGSFHDRALLKSFCDRAGKGRIETWEGPDEDSGLPGQREKKLNYMLAVTGRDGSCMGVLNVGISLTKNEEVKLRYHFMIMLLIIIMIAVILLATYSVFQTVIVPVNQIVEAVTEFAAGKKPQGLPVERQDEIGLLAREFGRLTEEIDGLIGEVTERERELSDYVDNLLSFNAKLAPDGTIVTANAATCSIVGLSREKLAGMKYWEAFAKVLGEASSARLRGLIVKSAADSDVRFAEFEVEEGHQRRFLDISVRPVGEAGQKNYYLIVEGLDITALRAAEEDLRFKSLLLDNSKNSIIAVDTAGRILYANGTTFREFGAAEEEVILSSIARFFVDDGGKTPPYERLADSEQVTFEAEMMRCDGSRFSAEIQISRAEIIGRRIAICVIRDTSGEKRAEALMRQTEENLKTIFNSAHYAIIISDLDGRIIDVNEKAVALLGVGRDSAAIYSFADDYTAVDFPRGTVIEAWNMAAGGSNQVFEWKGRRPSDNSVFTAEVDLQRIFLEHQEYIMITMHDITVRKNAEALLRKSEEYYRALIEDSSDIIVIIDPDDTVRYVSGSARRWLGYIPEQVCGRNMFDFIHPDDLDYLRKNHARLKSGDVDFNVLEVRCLHVDGSYRTFEILGKNLMKNASVGGIVCNLRDITEKRSAEAELARSIAKYKDFADLLPQPICEADITGNILVVNRAALEVFGYTAAELAAGLNVVQMVAPEDRSRAAQSFGVRLSGIIPPNRTFTMLKKDGTRFAAMLCSFPVVEEGKTIGLRTLIIDITQQKEIEDALRLDESRLEALLKLSQMTSSSLSEVTDFVLAECIRLTFSEGGFIAFLNEDETEMRMNSWSSFVTDNIPGFDPSVMATIKIEGTGILAEPVKLRRPLMINNPEDIENSHHAAPKGHAETTRYLGVPVFVAGRVAALVGVVNKIMDYTEADVRQLTLLTENMMRIIEGRRAQEIIREKEQKAMEDLEEKVRERTAELVQTNQKLSSEIVERLKVEKELHEREERYRTLTENVYDLICETDLEGRYLYLTPNNSVVLGYQTDELLGDYYYKYIHPEDLDAVNETFRKGVQGIKCEVVFRYRHKNGHYLWFSATGKLYHNVAGEARAVIISREITARKKLEEEMLKISKLESLGILAGGIAHDFNNVLMGIIGNLTLAKKRVDPHERVYDLLIRAEKVSYKAKNLTEQLITFSRGGLPVKKIGNVNEIVRDSAQFTLTGTSLECKYRLSEDIPCAEIDDGQISQVITNLVINAKQSMTDKGTIEISTDSCELHENSGVPLPAGKYVRIIIRDNGCGIAKEYITKIFDPYFTTKSSGSGLGLSTSYSIIRNHNGFITVESEKDAGSCFTIYLPARNGVVSELSDRRPETLDVCKFGAGRRILVMDDDESVVGPLTEMLTDMGFDVESSYDGDEAVILYKKFSEMGSPFTLVIMDLIVPGGMGGVEALAALRDFDPNVRAVVSSGYSSDPVMANFADHGFCGVLVKPYRVEDMESLLGGIL